MNNPCVFIVDDEEQILKSIERLLFRLPIDIKTFTSAREAIEQLTTDKPFLVISDLRMPFMSGLEFLRQVKELLPDCHRILLSAFQDFDQVIDGFNENLMAQFMSKPWDNSELLDLVLQHIDSPKQQVETGKSLVASIIGNSQNMIVLKEQINQVAGANVPIFISGQTGTGKELVAKACHEMSHRKENPFIAFNCANLNENLLESQLFGHKKGAFTGADNNFTGLMTQAGHGTLFLDEVTTLPLNLQAKLLRVIQEREFTPLGGSKVEKLDAQVLSASSKTLEQATAEGEFRPDLYYRLAVIKLSIPPLKDREQDALMLAEFFLSKLSKQYNKPSLKLADDAQSFLTNYAWPGNVRQLENVLHHLIIMKRDEVITQADIQLAIGDEPLLPAIDSVAAPAAVNVTVEHGAPVGDTLEDIERTAIMNAIDECRGNVSQAAAKLGVNPSTIYRKMQKWQVSSD